METCKTFLKYQISYERNWYLILCEFFFFGGGGGGRDGPRSFLSQKRLAKNKVPNALVTELNSLHVLLGLRDGRGSNKSKKLIT